MDSVFGPSTAPIPALVNGAPRRVGRSVTSPLLETGYSRHGHQTSGVSSNGVEMLFAHDHGRVIAFTSIGSASGPNTPQGSPSVDLERQTIGTLPWTSKTERLIASGRLKLHRVHTVAFLSAGDIVHPILAKSQCWCVDGESKFVLRIRGNAYYRIELPNGDEGDVAHAKKLKEVLSKILLYEKTPCPFQRGFTVELPDPPSVPVVKRRWKPPERPRTAPSERDGHEDEVVHPPSLNRHRTSNESASDLTSTLMSSPGSSRVGLTRDSFMRSPAQSRALAATRSITVPAKFYLEPANPLPTAPAAQQDPSSSTSSLSSASLFSVESSVNNNTSSSYHSVPSGPSSPETSPRKWQPVFPRSAEKDEDEQAEGEGEEEMLGRSLSSPRRKLDFTTPPEVTPPRRWRTTAHEEEEEEELPVVTSLQTEEHDETQTPQPTTPSLVLDEGEEEAADEGSEIKSPSPRRRLLQTQSPFSQPGFHTSPSSSSPSPSSTKPSSTKAMTPPISPMKTALLMQKTCSIMLGTSAQLISTMLNLARRILGGMLKGVVIGIEESGERIPCEWVEDFDYRLVEEEEEEKEEEEEEEEEDDQGWRIERGNDQVEERKEEKEGEDVFGRPIVKRDLDTKMDFLRRRRRGTAGREEGNCNGDGDGDDGDEDGDGNDGDDIDNDMDDESRSRSRCDPSTITMEKDDDEEDNEENHPVITTELD